MYDALISVEQLQSLLDADQHLVAVVDCRHQLSDVNWGRNSYEQSHIPGAYFAHLDEDLSGEIIPGVTGRHPLPELDAFASFIGSMNISTETQVVVYDQSHGALASRLWLMLKMIGHDKVAVLNGGWKRWTNAGGEVSSKIPGRGDGHYPIQLRGELIRSAEDVSSMSEAENSLVIDVRGAQRYSGEKEPIDPIAGHIPGAINLPFIDNVDAEGMWLGVEELARRYNIIKAYGADNTVMYCGSGVTGCHGILGAFIAGSGMPALYAGSWSHWITDSRRPVARRAES